MDVEATPTREHCPGRRHIPTTLEKILVVFWGPPFFLLVLATVICFVALCFAAIPLVYAAGFISLTIAVCRRPIKFLLWERELLVELWNETTPHQRKALPDDVHAVRLVTILRGADDDPVACNLSVGRWDESEYEALSYTWGQHKHTDELKYSIVLDGRPFFVRRSLFVALQLLRCQHPDRVFWIDALCIDQHPVLDAALTEKAQQIGRMCLIYHHATRVVVVIDVDLADTESLSGVEELFKNMAQSSPVTGDNIETHVRLLTPKEEKALLYLVHLPWWTRVWVVQEVVEARLITVRCGHHLAEWDHFCALVCFAAKAGLAVPEVVLSFINRAQALRKRRQSAPFGCIGLLYEFKDSKSSIKKDRIFALMNITLINEPELIETKDYDKEERLIFRKFTKRAIDEYKNLNALIGLEWEPSRSSTSRDNWPYSNPSWLYTWDLQSTKHCRNTLWNGGFAFQMPDGLGPFSASGSSQARCDVHLADPEIIAVHGFQCDIVLAVSKCYASHWPMGQKMALLVEWYSFASNQNHSVANATAFLTTVTAGQWKSHENQDLSLDQQDWMHHLDDNLLQQIDIAATGRRMCRTRLNQLALVHSNAQADDLICVLLGAAVPYVLRCFAHGGFWCSQCPLFVCQRDSHSKCCMPRLHRLVGQAYVENLMVYNGNIDRDLESSLTLTEYFLE